MGLSIVALSEYFSGLFAGSVPSLTISTALTVLLATAMPKQLSSTVAPGELLGKLLLLLFFGSIGNSAGDLAAALRTQGALGLGLYEIGLYAIHLAVVLGIGRAMGFALPDLLLGSNANIGNAATASALASSLGWRSRLLPAVLVGTLGNILGSYIGLWLGYIVLQPLSIR